MASSQTGQLDSTFLGSTNVIPNGTIRSQNRGNNAVKLVGRRNQRTWTRPGKGSVRHVVNVVGTPRTIRASSPTTL